MQFLLYGSYGYTGQLITRFAKDYGLSPILAGRNEEKLKAQAAETGFPYRTVDLKDKATLEKALSEVSVVLHAAGPFSHTFQPMVEACLKTGTHYTDITGEVRVFEAAAQLDQAAREAGILIMPGTGFDVVPTDCLALQLKEQLPDATELKLAFSSLGAGGPSRGTAKSAVEILGQKGAIRKDGKISRVPLGHEGMEVDFGPKKRFVMAIPWGDLSSAWHSTGIPNITTYMGVKPSAYRMLKWQNLYNWLLRSAWVKNYRPKQLAKRPAGPTDEQRKKGKTLVWGEVLNAEGKSKRGALITPDGYTTTYHASLLIVKKILSGDAPAGYQTPAGAYGSDLIFEVPGVERISLD
jgi:short subunit dehydrogenase-like uncharacterized protein